MRKLLVLSFVTWATAAGAGCCTSRAPTLACGTTAPAICSPIPCGTCSAPQDSQGVPAYGSDGISGPIVTTPGAAPTLTPIPGTVPMQNYSPAPSLAPAPSAASPGPSTFVPSTPATGNIPPSTP